MTSNRTLRVRLERPGDAVAIRAVNDAAFGRPDEALLVDRLRNDGAVLGSFVAEHEGTIVGHILFSRTLIETANQAISSVALAPLAVVPNFQRRGIGSELVRVGLEWLRSRGERIVLVLGEPHFYSRFGFASERANALTSPFPPEAFMALALVPNALDAVRGTVRYAVAFRL